METKLHIENYIKGKLGEFDKEKDMQDMALKGKLSFGMNSMAYHHLPNWQKFAQAKKQLIRWFWLDALLLSLLVTGFATNVWETFDTNWLPNIAKWIGTALVTGLFWVSFSFYSLFYRFRKTEREVRRLIYEDILHELKKEDRITA